MARSLHSTQVGLLAWQTGALLVADDERAHGAIKFAFTSVLINLLSSFLTR